MPFIFVFARKFLQSLDLYFSHFCQSKDTFPLDRSARFIHIYMYIRLSAPASILMYIIYNSIHTQTHTHIHIFLVEFLHIFCARLTCFVQEHVWLMIFYSTEACVSVCMNERANYMNDYMMRVLRANDCMCFLYTYLHMCASSCEGMRSVWARACLLRCKIVFFYNMTTRWRVKNRIDRGEFARDGISRVHFLRGKIVGKRCA